MEKVWNGLCSDFLPCSLSKGWLPSESLHTCTFSRVSRSCTGFYLGFIGGYHLIRLWEKLPQLALSCLFCPLMEVLQTSNSWLRESSYLSSCIWILLSPGLQCTCWALSLWTWLVEPLTIAVILFFEMSCFAFPGSHLGRGGPFCLFLLAPSPGIFHHICWPVIYLCMPCGPHTLSPPPTLGMCLFHSNDSSLLLSSLSWFGLSSYRTQNVWDRINKMKTAFHPAPNLSKMG